MSNAVVVQPWRHYPPAVAKIRLLNTNENERTILFLEPLWVWGQKIYSEDDIVLISTKLHKVSLGDGGSANVRLATSPKLSYEKWEPRQNYADNWQQVTLTPEEAKKWNKELLRSMVMDEAEYNAFVNPMMQSLGEELEEAVEYAGSSSGWEDMSEDMLMDDTRDEAEDFVRMLTPEQLIRLNHIYTGYTINDLKAAKDPKKVSLREINDTVDAIMEENYISDDAIYSAHISYLEGLEDSRWD